MTFFFFYIHYLSVPTVAVAYCCFLLSFFFFFFPSPKPVVMELPLLGINNANEWNKMGLNFVFEVSGLTSPSYLTCSVDDTRIRSWQEVQTS